MRAVFSPDTPYAQTEGAGVVAENGKSWVWYAAQEKDSGKLSVLAVVEVVLSVCLYWWIAVTWQTHLHLLVALIAAPLVLLRSEASIATVERMWDRYWERHAQILLKSPKGLGIAVIATAISFTSAWLLSKYWLSHYEGPDLLWRVAIVGLLSWNIAFAATVAIAISEALAGAVAGAAAGAVFGVGFGAGIVAGVAEWTAVTGIAVIGATVTLVPGAIAGIWLRSLIARMLSVLKNMSDGWRIFANNWQRFMLVEDGTRAPEWLPGVVQHDALFQFDRFGQRILHGDAAERILGLLIFFFLHLPSLLWRYSLKSTCWFYAPLIYIAARGKFADPLHRRLVIDRSPPLLDAGRFMLAIVALGVAFVAFVDWSFWRDLMGATEVFSPVGWLLVLDWGRIWDQPWQIPALCSAALTVGIFLWIDSLRKTRRRLEEQGEDPETAVGNAYSTEHHPGLTLYWLNRLRTVFVTLSLIIGFWYFTKGSYEAGYLTRIEPMLSSVFGAR